LERGGGGRLSEKKLIEGGKKFLNSLDLLLWGNESLIPGGKGGV